MLVSVVQQSESATCIRVSPPSWDSLLPSYLIPLGNHRVTELSSLCYIQWRAIYRQWFLTAATAAMWLQSCPPLCDPTDGSPPGSSVPWILQARTLEWVAISFSSAWKWKVKVKSLSHVWLLVTPWTAAHQAPPSMGFSRQEYWSGVPLPSPIPH